MANISPKLSARDSRNTGYFLVFQAKRIAKGATSTTMALWALGVLNQPITPKYRVL